MLDNRSRALVALVVGGLVATVTVTALASDGEWPLQKIAPPPGPRTALCQRILHGDTYVSFDASFGSTSTPAKLIAHYASPRPGVTVRRDGPDQVTLFATDGPHREALQIGPVPKGESGCGQVRKEHLSLLKTSRETSGPPR